MLLSAGAAGRQWTFVGDGPCDALLVGSGEGEPLQVQRRRGARAVGLIGSADAPEGMQALAWPLSSERFESWLLRTQALLGSAPAAGAQERFRLRRWPPAQLLRGEAARIRLATVLSRRAVSVPELAQVTGCDEPTCLRFVHLLLGFGLIDTEQRAAEPGPARHAPDAARWGLVRRIRQRLGL